MFSLLTAWVIILVHLLGFINALHAVFRARSAAAAVAWAIALIEFPYVVVPIYWVFGRGKFQGYVRAHQKSESALAALTDRAGEQLAEFHVNSGKCGEKYLLPEAVSCAPLTCGNRVEIFTDGPSVFKRMHEEIDGAKDYIIVQYFIFRDDNTGKELAERLMRKAAEGVRVYLLYDKIGSIKIHRMFVYRMRRNGIQAYAFRTTRRGHRFQLNFRNHRKFLCVDGGVAFVGGVNIGDEYLGKSRKFGPWRDTTVRVQGPAVQSIQLSFVEDWYWVKQKIPDLNWQPSYAGGANIQVMATGPVDPLDICKLMLTRLFNSAQKRIWITSPYFVPDSAVASALQDAAIRGIDVRVILPENPDHKLVYLCSFSYLSGMIAAGVKFYRYQPGFMHQKVLLIDEEIASIGTLNLDNRSIYLNFELSLLINDPETIERVETIIVEDLKRCRPLSVSEYEDRSVWFKTTVKVARLFEPVL